MLVEFRRFRGFGQSNQVGLGADGLASAQACLHFSRDHWSERSSLPVESCACEHGQPDSWSCYSMPLECASHHQDLWFTAERGSGLKRSSRCHRIWFYLLVGSNVSGQIAFFIGWKRVTAGLSCDICPAIVLISLLSAIEFSAAQS